MKRNCLLLFFFFWAVLPLTAACSDYDDQPGLGRNATPTVTAAAVVAATPTATVAPTPTATAEPGGWVWRLVETKVNPEQNPDEVCPEKPARCTWFTISEGGCVIDKLETETIMNTKIFEYQINCACDKPPEEIWPGEEYRLRVNCASELKYAAEGNSWIQGQVAICYYGVADPGHKQFVQPYEQQFWYRPWHPDYDGTTSLEWTLFGPWGELGDEFELIARCGDAVCNTHWRYTLQIDE
jgi:hypothetical protein